MSSNFDKVVNRLGTYCTQWDYIEDRFGQKNLLPFSISDTDFTCPEPMMVALKKRMEHEIFGYTRWNHEAFKGAVQKWYSKRFQTNINQETIVYSPSVMYTISKLINQLSDIGDYIVLQTPNYDAFFKMIDAHQRLLLASELKVENGYFSIDFNDLETKLAHPKAKLFILCHPHNPTGRIWTKGELQKLLALCEKHDVFIISDDIHMDVLRKGQKFSPLLEFTQNQNRMCICTSASKTFNTPGLMGSYAIIPNKDIRERFLIALKEEDGLSSASTLGILALMEAYESCEQWLDELNDYLDENMEVVKAFLKENYPEIIFIIPESTYLAWFDISPLGYSMSVLQEALIHVGRVAIMSGATYGLNSENYLRLNVGCPRSKLEEGLRRFKIAVEHLKKQEVNTK